MCVEAWYLLQYLHFSFHSTGFVMMKVAEVLLLSLTIIQPQLYVAGSGSGIEMLPPVLAAHATMCLLRSQKKLY